MHPPDQKCERAALADGPVSQNQFPCNTDIIPEAVREFQAASLRRRFALGYYYATVVAQLAFAGCPR
jgi:hypothetical protein